MTWAERIAYIASLQGGDYFSEHIPYVVAQRLSAHDQGGWAALDQVSGIAAELLFTRGPAFTRQALAPIGHVAPRAVAAYLAECDPAADALSNMIQEMSDTTNAFEILGFDVPTSVLESFRPYLPRVLDQKEFPAWRWTKGLTGLALNERLVWGPIAGHLHDQRIEFTPRETFGHNVQGLLAHLGGARVRNATFEEVEPAWWSFLAAADSLVDLRQIDYVIILWVARIVHHDVGGEALGTVGERLYADIQRCIAEGK